MSSGVGGRAFARVVGNPQPNSVKYFAAVELLEVAKERVAGENDKRVEPVLAEEKSTQETSDALFR
jgi:hypothetical protein